MVHAGSISFLYLYTKNHGQMLDMRLSHFASVYFFLCETMYQKCNSGRCLPVIHAQMYKYCKGADLINFWQPGT